MKIVAKRKRIWPNFVIVKKEDIVSLTTMNPKHPSTNTATNSWTFFLALVIIISACCISTVGSSDYRVVKAATASNNAKAENSFAKNQGDSIPDTRLSFHPPEADLYYKKKMRPNRRSLVDFDEQKQTWRNLEQSYEEKQTWEKQTVEASYDPGVKDFTTSGTAPIFNKRRFPRSTISSSNNYQQYEESKKQEEKEVKKSLRPYFQMTETNNSLTTSGGQTAYLHCVVENLGERRVSWIRRSDLKILTIGEMVYTQDRRFSAIHEGDSQAWILKVTDVRVEDSGEYECQISYHEDHEKKIRMPFTLKVLDSRAIIQESSDLHVQKGSKLSLSCAILRPSGPPTFVYWYRDKEVLNYSPSVSITETLHTAVAFKPSEQQKSNEEEKAEISSSKQKTRRRLIKARSSSTSTSSVTASTTDIGTAPQQPRITFSKILFGSSDAIPTTTTTQEPSLMQQSSSPRGQNVVSRLVIDHVVAREHSGNYTCAPSNARAAYVVVHVVNDESGPAAMQHGNGASKSAQSLLKFLLIFLPLVVSAMIFA